MRNLFNLNAILLIIFPAILSPGCKKHPVDCCTIVDIDISVYLTDSTGHDLLNPANPGSFNKEDITVYYVKESDGKSVLSEQNNFNIYSDSHSYFLYLFPYDDKLVYHPLTLIEWKKYNTDTLMCDFQRTENKDICTEIWLNGDQVWLAGTPRAIHIVK